MAAKSLRRMVDEMRELYGDPPDEWPLSVTRGRPTTDVELGPQAVDKL